MIAKLLAKIFGTQNERELKRLYPIVDQINSLESAMEKLSDADLKAKTKVKAPATPVTSDDEVVEITE